MVAILREERIEERQIEKERKGWVLANKETRTREGEAAGKSGTVRLQ